MVAIDYEKLYSGEHLKKIDPNWSFRSWSYRHTFVSKMKKVISHVLSLPKETKILDAGCGQGLLVEYFKNEGYDVIGIDAFYDNEHVKCESIMNSNFADDTFDLVLCLDVIEHIQLNEQEKVIKELTRVCKSGGTVLWSIPNMGNLSSRFLFLFTGYLLRTANAKAYLLDRPGKDGYELYHPGDRPINEYYRLISKYSDIYLKRGISAEIPILFQLTQVWPHYFGWLYFLLKPFQVFSGWCFNVLVFANKK
ncbi:class I SAM-dependent methyltransferase [archaeon]|jgi:SAM-dependent methyltransferase|nr:class I SAM-dependent methyltransferase [archaeon]MBT6762412.1 class I SAM-dependent methyltransferase [archaeon]